MYRKPSKNSWKLFQIFFFLSKSYRSKSLLWWSSQRCGLRHCVDISGNSEEFTVPSQLIADWRKSIDASRAHQRTSGNHFWIFFSTQYLLMIKTIQSRRLPPRNDVGVCSNFENRLFPQISWFTHENRFLHERDTHTQKKKQKTCGIYGGFACQWINHHEDNFKSTERSRLRDRIDISTQLWHLIVPRDLTAWS